MVIDAHLHLPVVTEQRTYEQARDLLIADLQRDHIDSAILIPDNVAGSVIGDFDTCHRLFAGVPNVFLMYMIDIEQTGPETIAMLASLLTRGQIVGLKIVPGHDPYYPTDARLEPVFALGQAYRCRW